MMSPRHGHLKRRSHQQPPWLVGLLVFLVILAVAWSLTWFLFDRSRQALSDEIRDGLKRTAAVIASNVDVSAHARLRSPQQEAGELYQSMLQPLRNTQAVDDRIGFLYTTILDEDGTVRLVLDTTPDDDPDAVDLMEVYEEPNDALLNALREGEAAVSTEPYTDPFGTFLGAYIPLRHSDGRLEGVLGLDLEVSEYLARLEPIRRASLLAGGLGLLIALSAGMATWWARRRDRQAKELARQLRTVNAMLDVSRALSGEVQLPKLLGIIIGRASEALDAERSDLFLYDSENDCLRGLVTDGSAADWVQLPIDKGVAGQAARSGKIVNVSDASADPQAALSTRIGSGNPARSVLAMPIIDADNALIGVAQVVNRRDGEAFDEDDETLLHALMAQAAVAIHRAQLTDAYVEKELLDEALRLAHDIQMNMLPRDFAEVGGDALDIFASLTPAKAIGGDFYDQFRLDEQRVCFVVADVSGKGIPAALFMAEAKTLIQALALTGLPTADILSQANDVLCRDNDASMFVTVFLAVFNHADGTLSYANAGHNLPYRVMPGGEIAAIDGAEAIALGAMDGFPFEQATITLQAEEAVYFYTDGVNEAMDERDEEFTQERLEDVLRSAAGGSARQLAEASVEAVREHCGAAEASDDLTVLAFRWIARV